MKKLLTFLVWVIACVVSSLYASDATTDAAAKEEFDATLSSEAIGKWSARTLYAQINTADVYERIKHHQLSRAICARLDRCGDIDEGQINELGVWIVFNSPFACWDMGKKMVLMAFLVPILSLKGEVIPEAISSDILRQLELKFREMSASECVICCIEADVFVPERGRPAMLQALKTCGHAACDWCLEKMVKNGSVTCPMCRTANSYTPQEWKKYQHLAEVAACVCGNFRTEGNIFCSDCAKVMDVD